MSEAVGHQGRPESSSGTIVPIEQHSLLPQAYGRLGLIENALNLTEAAGLQPS